MIKVLTFVMASGFTVGMILPTCFFPIQCLLINCHSGARSGTLILSCVHLQLCYQEEG